MHKNRKQKEQKQIKAKHETYASGLKSLFMHPSSLYYVVVCKEGHIRVLDLPTMSFVAQTQTKVPTYCSNTRKCVFTPNTNLFLTFSSNWVLSQHEISKGLISCIPSELQLETTVLPRIIEVSQTTNSSEEFVILLNDSFLLCDSRQVKRVVLFDQDIEWGFNISPTLNKWVVFSSDGCSLMQINPIQERPFSITSYFKVSVQKETRVSVDTIKKLVGLVDREGYICVLHCDEQITLAMRVKKEEEKSLQWIAFLHFGVGTSTTHKYEHRVVVLAGYEDIEEIMMEEKRENPLNFDLLAYTLEIEQDLAMRKTVTSFEKESVQVRSFKSVQKIWYCEYLENKMCYLNWNGDFQAVDLCLLEGKHTASEWVNLGFKFEALDCNQIYEEKEDQFDAIIQEKPKGISLEELDDWSYSLVPMETVIKKRVERLNCIQF